MCKAYFNVRIQCLSIELETVIIKNKFKQLNIFVNLNFLLFNYKIPERWMIDCTKHSKRKKML